MKVAWKGAKHPMKPAFGRTRKRKSQVRWFWRWGYRSVRRWLARLMTCQRVSFTMAMTSRLKTVVRPLAHQLINLVRVCWQLPRVAFRRVSSPARPKSLVRRDRRCSALRHCTFRTPWSVWRSLGRWLSALCLGSTTSSRQTETWQELRGELQLLVLLNNHPRSGGHNDLATPSGGCQRSATRLRRRSTAN